MAADEAHVKHALDLARTEINRQNPDLALEHLRRIRLDVEALEDSLIGAIHELLLAEALGASGDAAADGAFKGALEHIPNLVVPSPELVMRAHEHYADFLLRFEKRRSGARQHYESAKKIAVELKLAEDSARAQLKILRIDLETDQDPRLPDFQTLKKVAKNEHSTSEEQLAAWFVYAGDGDCKKERLLNARGEHRASEDYFRWLLRGVRGASK